MIIVLREKDPAAGDFSCRDGEIEYMSGYVAADGNDKGDSTGNEAVDSGELEKTTGYGIRFGLTETGDFPAFNIRVALENGDSEKVQNLLQGQTSRVDAASAERIITAIVGKAAEEFSRMVIDCKRMGLHVLPFRAFGMIENAEGICQYPSAQAVMLPCDTPPHPEITANSVQDNTLTLSLRLPVKPQRLSVTTPSGLKEGERVRVFVSYPLYIPKKDEITGTLGSVKSASGGNAMGIRFHFLSISRMKHSVSAPEKYYLLTGNENTGFHVSSKAADIPDYTGYAEKYGYVRPFPVSSLLPVGSGIDPMQWIADWEETENGFLPKSLPYIYRKGGISSATEELETEGMGMEYIKNLVSVTGCGHVLLTRPMTFADAEKSRRKAQRRSVGKMRIHGLPEGDSVAVLLGSDDGKHYSALRVWDPRVACHLFSPPKMWHRLLVLAQNDFGEMAIEV